MHTSHIEAVLSYEVSAPAHFLLNVETARWDGQTPIKESLRIEPQVKVQTFCDENSGNRFVRFDAPVGPLMVHYSATVRRAALHRPPVLDEVPVNQVPNEVLHYLMPTRYCESDLMARAAQQLFGDLPQGIGRVQAVCDWIHETIAYEPGSSDSTTTAREVFVQRAGVCRDFAHLGVTLCRALNIPARLVVGYVYFTEPPRISMRCSRCGWAGAGCCSIPRRWRPSIGSCGWERAGMPRTWPSAPCLARCACATRRSP